MEVDMEVEEELDGKRKPMVEVGERQGRINERA